MLSTVGGSEHLRFVYDLNLTEISYLCVGCVVDLNTAEISYLCVAFFRESKCVKSINQVIKILRDLCAMLLLDSFWPYSHYIVVPRKS